MSSISRYRNEVLHRVLHVNHMKLTLPTDLIAPMERTELQGKDQISLQLEGNLFLQKLTVDRSQANVFIRYYRDKL